MKDISKIKEVLASFDLNLKVSAVIKRDSEGKSFYAVAEGSKKGQHLAVSFQSEKSKQPHLKIQRGYKIAGIMKSTEKGFELLEWFIASDGAKKNLEKELMLAEKEAKLSVAEIGTKPKLVIEKPAEQKPHPKQVHTEPKKGKFFTLIIFRSQKQGERKRAKREAQYRKLFSILKLPRINPSQFSRKAA